MFKKTILSMCLSLPVLVMAQTAPAAPSAPAEVKPEQSAALVRNRTRAQVMAVCNKEAADQKLAGLDKREFMAKCVSK
jgi:hypothetical protein